MRLCRVFPVNVGNVVTCNFCVPASYDLSAGQFCRYQAQTDTGRAEVSTAYFRMRQTRSAYSYYIDYYGPSSTVDFSMFVSRRVVSIYCCLPVWPSEGAASYLACWARRLSAGPRKCSHVTLHGDNHDALSEKQVAITYKVAQYLT